MADRLEMFAANSRRWGDPEIECLDAYNDKKRIAFLEAIEEVMDSLRLDAIVYPSWNNKPALIERFEEQYRGDNSQVIAPYQITDLNNYLTCIVSLRNFNI